MIRWPMKSTHGAPNMYVLWCTTSPLVSNKDNTDWKCAWCTSGVSENTSISSMYTRQSEVYQNIESINSWKVAPLFRNPDVE